MAKRSIDLLSQFAWPKSTTVTMLAVVPSLFAGHVPEWLEVQARSPEVEEMAQAWARDHDNELRQNLAHLQEYVRGLPAPFDRAQSLVVEGDPASEILNIASSKQIDLVVLGTQAETPIISSLLGSTSEAVLNHAECSVLIVPAAESP
jgi:nucleotide-binding universal stress UspA family protein